MRLNIQTCMGIGLTVMSLVLWVIEELNDILLDHPQALGALLVILILDLAFMFTAIFSLRMPNGKE